MKLGHTILFFDKLPSTNDYLSTLASKIDPKPGLVTVSDYQLAGKGQFGRKWQSEAGQSLLCSTFLMPKSIDSTNLFCLHYAASLSVLNTLREIGVEDVRVKWPNDILAGQQKIAGILIENKFLGPWVRQSIVGLGLNLGQETFSQDLSDKATSVYLLTGKRWSRDAILEKYLYHMSRYYSELDSGHLGQAYMTYLDGVKEYREYTILGQQGDAILARVVGIDDDGTIHLEKNDGSGVCAYRPGEIRRR